MMAELTWGFWGHCNLCMLCGLCLFCNSNRLKSLFLISLMNFFFYRLSRFHQNLCDQTNTHHVGKLTKSNQIKVNIKSRTQIMWNADILLTNLLKIACTTLSSFQMLNQIAEFNSWKLISARWIQHQHNINAIITYSI